MPGMHAKRLHSKNIFQQRSRRLVNSRKTIVFWKTRTSNRLSVLMEYIKYNLFISIFGSHDLYRLRRPLSLQCRHFIHSRVYAIKGCPYPKYWTAKFEKRKGSMVICCVTITFVCQQQRVIANLIRATLWRGIWIVALYLSGVEI